MIFKANPGLAKELAAQPEHKRALADAAKPARDEAQRLADAAGAPWMRRRGAADTVVVDATGDEVLLVNTDHAGHLMEFGGRNNPPHAPLRRGVQAAGLRLDEHPKT